MNNLEQVENIPAALGVLYYFDQNSRVYEMNGVRKGSPYYRGYFRSINIVSETPKEFICQYGTINKISKMYNFGRGKFKTYTEKEMLDAVYVEENRHVIAENVRRANADTLREIEKILSCHI